jgi:hypothetical protein
MKIREEVYQTLNAGLEVSADASPLQNTEQSRNIKISIKSFQNVIIVQIKIFENDVRVNKISCRK